MVSDNPDLKDPFPEPPMAALRQGPNLRRILCKSKLSKKTRNPTRTTHRSAAGWKRCSSSGKKQCSICPYTPMTAVSVTSDVTGYRHTITTPITCDTENVVYLWTCKKCDYNCKIHTNQRNLQNFRPALIVRNTQIGTNYIGRTKRKFKVRMAEHRNYPKNGKVDEPSGEHFRLPGHAVSDLFGLAIEHVKSNDPFVLKAREALLIRKFDSYRNGLNKDPGS